ncbi:hypothetical protein CWB98_05445 [Pseudoalteromonas rubra]|uniref:Uncharacterized protein n=2 Tax=Pseudoalteromonas rubra TaxID=43658 RepID=A0A5S3X510_9GAMM|nr:hypothetical protein CWB98_05445 [Pseudoalteromonas rubra]
MISAFPGRATLTLLFALTNLCFTYIVHASSQTEFEQAYAPILVGGITTFIPIELTPDVVVKLSTKEAGGYTDLAWTPSPQADYYQILKFDGQTWQLVASNVVSTHYRYQGGGSFRVVACHRYGCSIRNKANVNVSDALAINAFYIQGNAAVEVGSVVKLGWQLSGATSAAITHTQNGVINSHQVTLLDTSSHTFSVYADSRFTLTVKGFNGEHISTVLDVATLRANPFLQKGKQSEYKQPLFGLDLDIIERTILQNEHHLVFSTHDGALYFFRAHKESEKPITWHQEWSINLEGVINSVPSITEGYVFYSETNEKNMGRVCKVRLKDKQSQTCSPYYEGSLLASPIVVNNDGDYSVKFLESFAGSEKKASGIYAFYYDGSVRIFDQQSLTPKPQSFTLAEQLSLPLINTPTLFLNRKRIEGLDEQILIKEQNHVLGVAIPTTQVVQQSQSFGVLAIGQQGLAQPMTVLWRGTL